MFHTSNSSRAQTPAPDISNMTGLERAKLERTYAPPPAPPPPPPPRRVVVEELPPQPVAAAKPKVVIASKLVAPEKPTMPDNPAHLYVGPGVTLKGEIFGCDTLRVEGSIEGNATARQLVVCSGGSFNGTVEIEEGDVEGKFEGTLNVAGRLFLRAPGRICGTLSYGQIEVERGGEILGDIAVRGANPLNRQAHVGEAPLKSVASAASEPLKKPSLLVRG